MSQVKFRLILSLFVALLSGCSENGIGVGSGGGAGAGGNGDGSPTLGITSIEKPAPALKPTQARGRFDRGLGFLFGNPVMAQSADCPPAAFKHAVRLNDGAIWITQAYLILDEIEFEVPTLPPVDGPEIGPFAFDLTATDPDVPQEIRPDVPPGNYSGMKFRIKRVDDFPTEQPKNLGDRLDSFMGKIFDDATKRRPSVWIEGVMQADGQACRSFKFVTDQEWRVRLPFSPGATVDPTRLDVVTLLDLPQAFETAQVTVAGLVGEIGGVSSPQDDLGGDFLDGRTTAPAKWGTENAKKVAARLPEGFKVFMQTAGTFVVDPGVDDTAVQISDDSGPVIGP